MTMSKSQMIDAIHNETGHPKAVVTGIVDRFLNLTRNEVHAGGKVELYGFGVFSLHDRAASKGRNPSTGEAIDIPAKRVAKFKPSKPFLDQLNNAA